MHLLSSLPILLGAVSTVLAAPRQLSYYDTKATAGSDWMSLLDIAGSSEGSLYQIETNGKSLLGTPDAPHFKQFRGQQKWGELDNLPWEGKTAKNTSPYTDAPDTGVVRSYDWTIERAILAPDGVNRSMILVDGSFPGPTIEANWGDTISVTVHNRITAPEEGTALHWHGFLQKGTAWMDGVPGINQCPIAPGESFTYTFKADLYGTSWWHAHYSAQYVAGTYGAMIIHGPDQKEVEYDADLGPVLLADYFHKDYFSLVQDVMSPDRKKIAPKSDNNLINGKGIFNCSKIAAAGANSSVIESCTPNAGLARFNFKSGETYRLRLVNAGAEGIQKFSIDDHEMTVMQYDFVPIKPYTTKVVTLGIGQRADILVKATGNAKSSYFMRSTMALKCSLTTQPNGLAMVYYEDADVNALPTSNPVVDNTDPCANDDLSTMVPYYPMTPPLIPDRTYVVDVNLTSNATNHTLWTMNKSSFRVNFNDPILQGFIAGRNDTSFAPERNIVNFGDAQSIRIIVNNLSPIAHPMHMHGHNMYVLSSTNDRPAYPTIINPTNPARRDVHILPPNGQMVVQIDADNPGVWPFHCHIAWHVSSGLYMNLLEHPSQIPDLQVPDASKDLCTKWEAFTDRAVVDQIDSGLRMAKMMEKMRA